MVVGVCLLRVKCRMLFGVRGSLFVFVVRCSLFVDCVCMCLFFCLLSVVGCWWVVDCCMLVVCVVVR